MSYLSFKMLAWMVPFALFLAREGRIQKEVLTIVLVGFRIALQDGKGHSRGNDPHRTRKTEAALEELSRVQNRASRSHENRPFHLRGDYQVPAPVPALLQRLEAAGRIARPGGEPLLRPDLFEIVDHLGRRGPQVNLITCGARRAAAGSSAGTPRRGPGGRPGWASCCGRSCRRPRSRALPWREIPLGRGSPRLWRWRGGWRSGWGWPAGSP